MRSDTVHLYRAIKHCSTYDAYLITSVDEVNGPRQTRLWCTRVIDFDGPNCSNRCQLQFSSWSGHGMVWSAALPPLGPSIVHRVTIIHNWDNGTNESWLYFFPSQAKPPTSTNPPPYWDSSQQNSCWKMKNKAIGSQRSTEPNIKLSNLLTDKCLLSWNW